MNECYIVRIGRDAITGRFVSIEEANRRPKETIVQTIKIPRKNKNCCGCH